MKRSDISKKDVLYHIHKRQELLSQLAFFKRLCKNLKINNIMSSNIDKDYECIKSQLEIFSKVKDTLY